MGNALEASKAALAKDLIGGNQLEAKFAAIDAGIKGVQDWKKNIDLERLTLKQNTQKEIREAEEAAKGKLGDNETANSKILEALETYKNQRLTQEKLVRIGSLNPDDNLIFEQNGQQTFETFIDFTNKFGEELELTKKRAKGYYKDNEDGTQTFVPPISGGVEAANQKLVTQIGTLSGVDFGIDDKGMGTVSFYKMKINPKTRTYEPVLDDEGNPVLAEGENTTSVLALKHDNNTRAQRVYLTKDIQEFSQGPGAASYQEMMRIENMSGNIVDDLRQRPGMGQFIETEVASKYGTIDATASLFVDNGIGGKVVPFNEWDGDKLYDNSGKDVSNETITIIGIDENFNEKEYTVKKYTKQTVANNNKMVTEMSDEQIEASHAFARKGYVDSLQKKIQKGDRDSQFDQNTPQKRGGSKSDIDKGTRTIAALNNLRGAKTTQDMELAIQELQGISGLSYSDISETTKTVSVPDGKGGFTEKEIVTAINLNLGGQIIPVEFGEVVKDEKGRDVFKQTSGEDFVKSNYEYFNKDGVSADIGFDEFKKRGSAIFEDVSQPGKGSRTKTYKQTKNITLAGEYNLGGSKTSLSSQLTNAFDKADTASYSGQDMSVLVGGVEAAVGSAYDALGLSLPKGFSVKSSGNNLIISAIDAEGITVKETISNIGNASDNGDSILQGGVQAFLNKMNQ